jgi:hypothetical protein
MTLKKASSQPATTFLSSKPQAGRAILVLFLHIGGIIWRKPAKKRRVGKTSELWHVFYGLTPGRKKAIRIFSLDFDEYMPNRNRFPIGHIAWKAGIVRDIQLLVLLAESEGNTNSTISSSGLPTVTEIA